MSARRAALLAGVLFACAAPGPPAPVVPAWTELPAGAAVDVDERALWAEADAQHAKLAQSDLVADAALTDYLNGVLQALVPSSLSPAVPQPRLHVVRDSELQAATSANGLVYVSLGMLAEIENEAQLAALLGHELGHFLGRHSLIAKRYEAVSRSTVERADLSRELELAADRIGLERMRAAGYDPHEALRLLTLLRADDLAKRTSHPAWESHPYVDERITRLQVVLSGSARGELGRERYESAIAAQLATAVELDLARGLLPRARATLARFQRLQPESGHGYFLAGQIERLGPAGRSAPSVRAAYERAVQLSPQDPAALRALGLLCRDLDDVPCATAMLARYLRAAPDADDARLVARQLETLAAP
jgi:predicted Zn-dependent protease